MITKELLHRNVQYVKDNKQKLNYYDVTEPMFVNGKFNRNNWNGGDDIIRQLFSEIEDSDSWKPRIYQNDKILMIIDFDIQCDDRYGKIIVIELENHSLCFEYEFSWYKRRCRTDLARIDNKLLDEETYIKLLNQIEEMTGYKFEFYIK